MAGVWPALSLLHNATNFKLWWDYLHDLQKVSNFKIYIVLAYSASYWLCWLDHIVSLILSHHVFVSCKVSRDLSVSDVPLQHHPDDQQRLREPLLLLSGKGRLHRNLHWLGRQRQGGPSWAAWKPDDHCWQCCHQFKGGQLGWQHFLCIRIYIKTIQIPSSPNSGLL